MDTKKGSVVQSTPNSVFVVTRISGRVYWVSIDLPKYLKRVLSLGPLSYCYNVHGLVGQDGRGQNL